MDGLVIPVEGADFYDLAIENGRAGERELHFVLRHGILGPAELEDIDIRRLPADLRQDLYGNAESFQQGKDV